MAWTRVMAMEFKSSRWILDLISWNGQDLGNGLAVKIRGQSDLRIYFWSSAWKLYMERLE